MPTKRPISVLPVAAAFSSGDKVPALISGATRALTLETLLLGINSGFFAITTWQTTTAYVVNQFVVEGTNVYRALVAHTSGTFATDLAADKWVLAFALPAGAQGPVGSSWHSGLGVPGSGLGANGDFYLRGGNGNDAIDGEVYYKAAGAWTLQFSILGPASTTPGPAGPPNGRRWIADLSAFTDADPGAGKVRANSATWASITKLWFDDLDAAGQSAATWLNALDDSTTTTARGILRLEDAADPDNYLEMQITANVVDKTGYREVTGTYIGGAGYADTADLVATFSRTGDAGAGSGDMAKAIYDTDDDGKVDVAELAESVPWSGVTSTPTTLAGYSISDAQALSAILTALAGATLAADKGIYATGAAAFATYDLDAFVRGLGGSADAATFRAGIAAQEALLTTRGDLLTRGAAADQRLGVGAANEFLTTDGNDPLWSTLTSKLDALFGNTRGIILRRGATAWEALAVGSNGQVLTSDGTDPGWAAASGGGGGGAISTCNGRLTLSTGVPVLTADVTAATTIYFTPYLGNQLALYDGSSAWTLLSFTEKSIGITVARSGTTSNSAATITGLSSTADLAVGMEVSGTGVPASRTIVSIDSSSQITMNGNGNANGTNTITFKVPADRPVDVFGWNNSGTLQLEQVLWTNATTRATAITTQDGVYVKTGDTTRRYLGTYTTWATAGQTDYIFGGSNTAACFSIWNAQHRQRFGAMVTEPANSWTYDSTTTRALNNNTNIRIKFVVGLQLDSVVVTLTCAMQATTSNISSSASQAIVALGLDSTTTISGINSGMVIPAGDGVNLMRLLGAGAANYRASIAVGQHYIQALEKSDAAFGVNHVYYGDNNVAASLATGIAGVFVQ